MSAQNDAEVRYAIELSKQNDCQMRLKKDDFDYDRLTDRPFDGVTNMIDTTEMAHC